MTKLAGVYAVLAATATHLATAQTQYLAGSPNIANSNPNPNATAVVPVAGWNLAKPYPGLWNDGDDPATAVGQGWTMHLNITANVSTADRSYAAGDDRAPWAMRQTIELRPPTPPAPGAVWDPREGNWTVDKNTTDTWTVSFASFSKVAVARGGKNNKDGSCEGFLSRECIDGMKQGFAQSIQAQSGNYSDNRWSMSSVIHRSCNIEGWAHPWPVQLNENFTIQATQLWDEPIKAPRGQYESAYDYYGSRAIPYVIIWGHSNRTAVGQPLSEQHVTVGCIKADTAVGDSRLPSSANTKTGSVGMLWAVSAAVALMLMV